MYRHMRVCMRARLCGYECKYAGVYVWLVSACLPTSITQQSLRYIGLNELLCVGPGVWLSVWLPAGMHGLLSEYRSGCRATGRPIVRLFCSVGCSMWMSACLYACMHVWRTGCMSVGMHVCLLVWMHICRFACMPVCMYECLSACMHVWRHVCMSAGMHVCLPVRTYVCRHECLSVGTHA